MATLNLGRIKPVFRGAYAGGTAYVVDDIVTSGNETFICIQASTGNATSNASYWTKLAAKGTDGTDVGATLTTQGDVLYRDGSGLQRLAKGTAAQVLAINSGATAPEWVTAAGGSHTYIGGNTFSSVSEFNIDTLGSGYTHHLVRVVYQPSADDGNNLLCRYRSSGSTLTDSNYNYYAVRGNSSGTTNQIAGEASDKFQVTANGSRSTSYQWIELEFTSLLDTSSSDYPQAFYRCSGVNHDGARRAQFVSGACTYSNYATTALSGINFVDSTSGTITGSYKIWGRKA
jgi:hypothetical protein